MSMLAQKVRRQIRRMSRKRLRSGVFFKKNVSLAVFSLVFAVLGWGASQVYHQHLTTLPEGSVFWGESLSGLTRAEAEEFVQEKIWDWYAQKVDIVVQRAEAEDTVVSLTVSELGFDYDIQSTVHQYLQIQPMQLTADVLHSSASETVNPALTVQAEALNVLMERVISHEEAPQDARILLDEASGEWKFSPHKDGYGLGSEQQLDLAQQLHQLALSPNEQATVYISLQTLSPKRKDADLEDLYERVQLLLQKKVYWTVDGYEVLFSLQDYPWMIEVDEEQGELYISESELRKYVDEWALMFDRDVTEVQLGTPVLQEKGHLRASFDRLFEQGRKLNREKLLQDLLLSFDQDQREGRIELSYENFSPVMKSWEGQELSRLSQGRSSYALAHSDDRLYNVRFGLEKYDGVVIPQGEEFSYNQILGWVTYDAGWKPALAIFGGGGVKPVPGGGLCQVSTTVFRAAVHEGLPITQRKPHSLDVSYYHAYGDGIDATIYPPADLDLKFVNDTPGPIVIHTYLDEVAEEVFVEFYGVDDGREIELKQVENRSVKLPSEVVYTDQLAPGEKEVITARAGRYVEWDWKITRDDGSVEERSIESLYPARRQTVRIGE
jgi:vancomycin resistance protein YoaR